MSDSRTWKFSIAAGTVGSLMLHSVLALAAATGIALLLVLVFASVPARAESSLDFLLPAPLQDRDFLYDGAPNEARFELGRNLFFDPILSGNRNISCGTCHDPANGTSDGVALSIGEGGTGLGRNRRTADGVTERIPRNAQALWNIGSSEYRSMFHDGRVEPDPLSSFQSGYWSPAREHLPAGLDNVLAAQAMFPVLSAAEMAGQKGENPVATAVAEDRVTDAWDLLAARLAATPQYQAQFGAAFPGRSDITFAKAANALAAFQTQAFRTDDSPFDHFIAGSPMALSDTARAGADLFYGKAGCAGCHSGALLTDHDFHAIAVPQIGPGKGHGADTSYWRATGFGAHTEDEGRYRVTFDTDDLFAYRTPSLRNVALTGPWGHDGAFDDLEVMVRHHLDSIASLERYDGNTVSLPPLDKIIEQTGDASELIFRPLNPGRRAAFDLRDGWVQNSADLRGRIARANELAPVNLQDQEVSNLMAFLASLTDPTAHDRSHLIPTSVPSGLAPQPTRPVGPPPKG
ncbi:cytochrome-c peroxidase [Sedimentitalea todarodis]|uniref:Cytochrome c peroxidase n=1 Tax=Sedimentitalea todarodis TaxID=1631240 RepID=A0ABU3VLP1_9RHOB|nr:cytochrome c peroxidase [Sedimentitalea todarodis]MDU9007107.1 cytochrome c peroxidase [Sedimentitalea todarodis]